MNAENHSPIDDPRLTAYALGELEGNDRAEIEALLETNAAARAEVEAIRRTAGEVTATLRQEPAGTLPTESRTAVLAGAAPLSPAADVGSNWRGVLMGLSAVAALAALGFFLFPRPAGERSEVAVTTPEGQPTATQLGDHRRVPESRDLTAAILDYAETPLRDADESYFHSGRPDQSAPDNQDRGRFAQRNYANDPSYRSSGRRPTETEAKPGEPGLPSPAGSPANYPVAETKPTSGNLDRLQDLTEKLPASAQSGKQTPGDAAAPLATTTPASRPSPQSSAPADPTAAGAVGQPAPAVVLPLDPAEVTPGNEGYNQIVENKFLSALNDPLSTFSIDVDTASYSNVRRFLKHGQWPPADAVRIEELVNYFRYQDAPPADGTPFATRFEMATCPWNAEHLLVRIGIKGREIPKDQRPPSNIVFLIDTSGSMSSQNKLPLVQQALSMLVYQMTEDDHLAIVTYAGSAGLVLDSTDGEQKERIQTAIQNLRSGGSTAGAAGIQLAYDVAVKNFNDEGTNRIILCTDGDFNVGPSSDDELVKMIQQKAKSGVFLSVFGFGMGNLKDSKLEQLADKGNGNYGYIDSLREAQKVFVEDMAGTLITIAKDVKIQVEFNPQVVGSYRLVGYENRILAHQDFNDDTKDAGEIGAGHSVTALYEIVPAGLATKPREGVDGLKYQKPGAAANVKEADELLTVKLRYKLPEGDVSTKLEFPLENPLKTKQVNELPLASSDLEWASAVAGFGMLLRNSEHKGQASYDLMLELAQGARGDDKQGHRREFIELLMIAKNLKNAEAGVVQNAPQPLAGEQAQKQAAVNGKYQNLLKQLNMPSDLQAYGGFNDYGYWAGNSYAGQNDLPAGHWVYVYPTWYIWGEKAENK